MPSETATTLQGHRYMGALYFLCRLLFFASSISFFAANRFLVFFELVVCLFIQPFLFAMVILLIG
jgi:hypothetical protein